MYCWPTEYPPGAAMAAGRSMLLNLRLKPRFPDPIDEPVPDAPPGPALRLPFVAPEPARPGRHQHGPVVQQPRVPAQ